MCHPAMLLQFTAPRSILLQISKLFFTFFISHHTFKIHINWQTLFDFYFAKMFGTGLFPRRAEKQKRLIRMISGIAILTSDISKYPCLSDASTFDHYSTTQLQYSMIKIFTNVYRITFTRLHAHGIFPAYRLTQLSLIYGPLKHFERSNIIYNLSQYICHYLEILKEKIINTDPDEMWHVEYDNSLELFNRLYMTLNHFVAICHPNKCIKCSH